MVYNFSNLDSTICKEKEEGAIIVDIENESRQRTKRKKQKSTGRTILTVFGFLLLFFAKSELLFKH